MALDLKQRFTSPVGIEAVDLVSLDGKPFVRATSTDGAVGIVLANSRLPDIMSLLERLVIPFLLGTDARDVEALVDGVYTHGSNYKCAGMPFWNCVAHVELALLDMLGRIAEVPAGELLGEVLRTEIPVYLSRFGRDTGAEEEVEAAEADLAATGARAVKLKIGRRMANTPEQTQRDREMIVLARERLGDEVTIYVDANGSYDFDEAFDMGWHLEDYGVGFLEEPCPWQDVDCTKRVADALQIEVAGGEQDSSLPQFLWMIRNRVVDVVQPDVFYNGGLIRCLRVAEMAEERHRLITPHSPRTGLDAFPTLHFLSVVPNIGPYHEYRAAPEVEDGQASVPTGPGLGYLYPCDEISRL